MDITRDYIRIVDEFYFQEFLPKLHPSLQAIGSDSRVLRHTETYRKMETIVGDISFVYWSNPWAVQDIFPVTPAQCTEVAKAICLLFIQCTVVDNYVDGQTPDDRLIAIYAQQLGTYAAQQLATLFPAHPHFWDQYYDAMIQYFHGMALEYESVVGEQPTFSPETMQTVDSSIAYAFRIQCAAMGILSNREAYIEPVSRAFEYLLLGDQFADDSIDWLEDWQLGRTRMPMLLLREAEDCSLEELFALPAETVEDLLHQHGILLRMVDSALENLQKARTSLPEPHQDGWLAQLIQGRMDAERQRKSQYRGVGILRTLSKSLRG